MSDCCDPSFVLEEMDELADWWEAAEELASRQLDSHVEERRRQAAAGNSSESARAGPTEKGKT